MSEYCVVVAGGTAARILALEPAEIPELQSGPNLVERTALTAPQQQHLESDPGGRRHDRASARRFVRDIASAVERAVHRDNPQHVVVCADRRLLGMLRPTLNGNLNGRAAVHEVPKDLGKLSLRQLHDKLSYAGHLPRRRAAG